jgi:hypothetical protein
MPIIPSYLAPGYRRITIEVTQQDIDDCKDDYKDFRDNPIALAISRYFSKVYDYKWMCCATRTEAGTLAIYGHMPIPLPDVVRAGVEAYWNDWDKFRPGPTSFEVDLPEEWWTVPDMVLERRNG